MREKRSHPCGALRKQLAAQRAESSRADSQVTWLRIRGKPGRAETETGREEERDLKTGNGSSGEGERNI